MKCTEDFKNRVASVIDNEIVRDDILNERIDIGNFLMHNAFRGIDSKFVLECLSTKDYEYLETIARNQEMMKSLCLEYFDCYYMKSEPTLVQKK